MGLPKRPGVMVQLPGALFVGTRVVIDVVLEVERETKVDFIDVRILGAQRWALGSEVAGDVTFPSLAKRVMDAGVLPVGSHRFPVAFTLPPGTAPHHDVRPARGRVYVDVHASIPWWPDGRYRFELPARLPAPPHAQRTPVVTRGPFQATGDEPRMEVALASSTLVAGEVLLGSCAVFHLADDAPREVDIAFEPHLLLHSERRQYSRWGDGYRTTIALPAGSAGSAVPFRVSLPDAITPTFATASHELQWYVKLKVGSLFTTKLEIMLPVVILDASAADTLPALTLVPRVADERVVAVFDQVARERALQLITTELEAYPNEQPALVRELGDAGGELRVGYDYRGKQGTMLVARTTYESLGLGLSVTPSSALREALSNDIEIDVAAWDRVHRVDARSAHQAVPFLRAVVPTPSFASLVRWTDDEIVFERKVAAVSRDDIVKLFAGLEQVAAKIAAARAAIAPPVDVDLGAWRAFAERLDGRLCIGDLSIEGTLDTTPVEVALVFDEERRPTFVRAYVGDALHASARAREVALSLVRPAAEADLVTTERLAALLATWPGDITQLELVNGVASASVPLPAGLDPLRVRELVRTLQSLLAALDESTGPYR